jgi:hypothetical protein
VKILVRKVMKRSSSSRLEEAEKLGMAGGEGQQRRGLIKAEAYTLHVVVCLKNISSQRWVSMLHGHCCGREKLSGAHFEPLFRGRAIGGSNLCGRS